MKTTIKYVVASVLAFAIGATGAYYATTHKYEAKIVQHQKTIDDAAAQISSFCEGQKVGDIRITRALCGDVKEYCLCVHPDKFRADFHQ